MSLSPEQLAEIAAARAEARPTLRPVSPGAEAALFTARPVLDSGFVRLVDYMGDDGAVVQGARVSYGRGTKAVSDDRNLIRYLMRHKHTTPFELCVAKFHVRAPIFVTRQWFRHRTASINEYSARYSVLEREFYFPRPEDMAAQSATNRQGRAESLPPEQAEAALSLLREDASRAYDHYLHLLNADEDGKVLDESRTGLARELARMNLPINVLTQFYWQANLWNLLHFLKLRADPHAQMEIRAYAEAMLEIVQAWVPTVFEAFADYMRDAANISGPAMQVLRAMLAGEPVTQEASGLSKREWRELMETLGR
ncbi:FAD-dependent thymidylate synthase [Roseococcus sp. DSY-14]|uniref:FAD-dependent thymidylate synthase n=1 Tax=Roseococcus sp. DSY-14 TaxID=3369650 RepID=UPI00387AF7FB